MVYGLKAAHPVLQGLARNWTAGSPGQQWEHVHAFKMQQREPQWSPVSLMWSSAWKSKIDARFIIKLFVSFRGVAAKGLVRNGRPRTHKQKTELRNRLWQDTKLSSFARVFFASSFSSFYKHFFLPSCCVKELHTKAGAAQGKHMASGYMHRVGTCPLSLYSCICLCFPTCWQVV